MEINIKDEIIILDEAHNIEDFSREAASYTVSSKQLTSAIADLDQLCE